MTAQIVRKAGIAVPSLAVIAVPEEEMPPWVRESYEWRFLSIAASCLSRC